MYKYLSINIGNPVDYDFDGFKFKSSLNKKSSDNSLFLSKKGIKGDTQSDTLHHGGEFKAVCFYANDNYNYWENKLNIKLENGAFGETITTKGLTEKNACIGDIYKIGEGIVQITQPRQPCFKFGYFYKYKNLPVEMENTGFTGFYGKVLQEGILDTQGSIKLLEKDIANISIDFINNLLVNDQKNVVSIEKALELEHLSSNIKNIFLNRLKGDVENPHGRLFGKDI